MIENEECYYCKRSLHVGQRLRMNLTAEIVRSNKAGYSASGRFQEIYICPDCARDYLNLRAMEHSNTSEALRLLIQQLLPAQKRISGKWNPSRRYE